MNEDVAKINYHKGTESQIPGIPEGRERVRFERQAKRSLLTTYDDPLATPVDCTSFGVETDTTSSMLEYDIAGGRVVSLGQTTGGYLREVAENELAFMKALQDPVALYILKKLADSKEPIYLDEMSGMIGSSSGWLRFAVLMKAGLMEMVGAEVRATSRGLTELNRIRAYCDQQQQNV